MKPDGHSHRFPWIPIAVFLVIAAAIATGGRLLYRWEADQYKEQKGDELLAIADLKARQIAAWRTERLSDGVRLTRDPFFVQAAAEYLAADPAGRKKLGDQIQACLRSFPELYDYLSAQLLTADGGVLLGAGACSDAIGNHAAEAVRKAAAGGRPEFSDLHRASSVTQQIHMDIAIPLPPGDGGAAGGPAALVLLLRLNPEPYLYPLIQSWPSLTETAESVLVRREGDEPLALNELRHRKNTALRLRLPASAPATRALTGERGVVEGVDYRGMPVLAAVTQVPDSNWGLVSKIDQTELYAPLRMEARQAAVVAAALILATGLLMAYLWKKRDASFYRDRHRMEMERDALLRHFDLVMRNGNDIILLLGEDHRVLEANDRAVAAYGYPWEALRTLRLDDLRAKGTEADLARHLEHVAKAGGDVYETVHRRKDGSTFPVETSLRFIETGGARFYQAIIRDISERKLAEQALMRERDLAQTYLDVVGVIIAAMDREGRITLINRSGWSSLGYANACELIGKNWFDTCRPEGERPQVRALFAHLMSGTGGGELLAPHINSVLTRSGEVRSFSFHSSLLKDAAGAPAGLLFSGEDITDRRRAEERLERMNRLYAVMININQAVVRIQDREKLFQSACEAFVQFGRFQLAWIGMVDGTGANLVPVAHAGTWDEPSVHVDSIPLDAAKPENLGPASRAILENRCVTLKDTGTELRVEPWRGELLKRGHRSLAAVPLRIGKTPAGVLSLHAPEPDFFGPEECRLMEEAGADISFAMEMLMMMERRQQAEAERMRLAQVVEQAAEAVVITDTDGVMVYVNPAFEAMTGYSRAEAAGRNPRILQSGKHSAAFYEEMWRTLRGGRPWSGTMINRRKDGTLLEVETVVAPIHTPEGVATHYVADMRDISREKQLERQFFQSQKMEAVGKLAGGVAHDFNNQLHAILGFCNILLDALPPEDPNRADVLEIQAASQRAAELTRQLLTFSRPQPTDVRVASLNAIIGNVGKMLGRLIGENIRMVEALDAALRPVRADAGMIGQVLMNLVVNARDAMPDGGTLTISTSNVDVGPGDELLLQTGASTGNFACLAVADTGTGMTEEVRAHIFEPFFTTKPMGKGTGMGLATVYSIIRQHGGWIAVASEPGRGSTFRLFLPACAPELEPAPAATEAPGESVQPGGRGERILLVEDETIVRDMTRRVLESAGYAVLAAGSAEEAVAAFERENGRVDLLFSDILLAGKNGIAFADGIREKRPGLPVVVCSGYMDDDSRALLQKRNFHFLQKPYHRADLLEILHRLLHGTPPPAA